MKTVKITLRAGFLAMMLVLFMGTGIVAIPAQAASGSVYSCAITGCYSHPVTGVIEDSGGESSYELGSSMVSSVVYTNGILEVTSDGQYYVTVRMSLMDYTSNHQFWVQNVGDSGWMTGAIGTTGTGTDSNGATADFCIQVPSENCIIRCSMYVQPMGRDVVFYIYPSNYSEGNGTNMNATIVTESASSGTTSAASESTSSGNSASSTTGTTSSTTTSGTSSAGTVSGSTSAGTGSLASSSTSTGTTSGSTTNPTSTNGTTTGSMATGGTLTSSLDGGALTSSSGLTSASTGADSSGDDSTLSQAEGLSLSTAGDTDDDTLGESLGSMMTSYVFVVAAAFTSSALILICAVAGIVYLFRRNWYRWGGGDYDDE